MGNEDGVAPENESSVVERDGRLVWYPSECCVSIRRGWFYHAEQDAKVKSLATLAALYFKSVGRNSVLLLNVPPDRRGRIAEVDAVRLKEFGEFVKEFNATDFLTGAAVKVSNCLYAHWEGHVRDGILNTFWMPADDRTTGWIEFDLGEPKTFNVARIQEEISLGERVQAYHVEVLDGDNWLTVTDGRVIGHKQLRIFPAVTAQRVRLVIDKAAAPPAIAEFGLHWNRFVLPASLAAPSILRYPSGWMVIIGASPMDDIRYTLDGSEPTLDSPAYVTAIYLPDGGVVCARAVLARERKMGEIVTVSFGSIKEK